MVTRVVDPAQIAPPGYLKPPQPGEREIDDSFLNVPDPLGVTPTPAYEATRMSAAPASPPPVRQAAPMRTVSSAQRPCLRIPLQYPVEVSGTIYDHIMLRRARAKDMRVLSKHLPVLQSAAEKTEASGASSSDLSPEMVDALVAIVAALSDLSVEVVDEFDFEDLTRAVPHLGGFFPHASD